MFEKEAVQAFPSVILNIPLVHAREKAEDAEVAAALREPEKALTNYQTRTITCPPCPWRPT